jgi:hypothetical protein
MAATIAELHGFALWLDDTASGAAFELTPHTNPSAGSSEPRSDAPSGTVATPPTMTPV